MKILLISPQPFFRVRGTPINIRNMAVALGAAGHEVDLLCYPFGEDLEIPGVRILRSPRVPGVRDVKVGPSAAKFPLDGLMALRAAWRIFRGGYDVAHAVEEAVFFTSPWARLRGIPYIYDMDSLISHQLAYSGFLTWKPLLRLVEGMEKRAMRRAARVVTVCRSLTERARELEPGAEIRQIEDAPPTPEFLPDAEGAARLREELDLGDRPCVVYTGNFEAYQGVEVLVDAMAHVKKEVPEAVAVLAGGEERHRRAVEERIRGQGLEACVRLAGERPMSDMPAFLTLATVLASPRVRGTNTALKLYGYMQTGRPIVATRLETHTQVLDESCAWLTRATPEAFAAGLVQALRDSDAAAARGAESRRRVEEAYGLERFDRQIRELYAELEPGGAPREAEG